MREIKFRIWNDVAKEMYFMDNPFWDDEYEMLAFNGEMQARGTSGLMQFTGVYDKNGREIYEGDILQWYMHRTALLSVVEWKTEWCAFVCFSKTASGKCWTRPGEETELLGNIYETPYLLQQRPSN